MEWILVMIQEVLNWRGWECCSRSDYGNIAYGFVLLEPDVTRADGAISWR